MLILLTLIGIIFMPYCLKNKNLKESTRTTCFVVYAILLILYFIFGIWLG